MQYSTRHYCWVLLSVIWRGNENSKWAGFKANSAVKNVICIILFYISMFDTAFCSRNFWIDRDCVELL